MSEPETGTKYCSWCRTWKPLEAFGKDRSRQEGARLYCRECTNAYQRLRYHADPTSCVKRREYTRQWRIDNPEKHAEQNARYRARKQSKRKGAARE